MAWPKMTLRKAGRELKEEPKRHTGYIRSYIQRARSIRAIQQNQKRP